MEVIKRGRNFIVERDPAWPAGQRRATITVHDQHYTDDGGQWQPVIEDIETDGLDGFAHKADRFRHRLRVATDGTRRWYPRRGVTTEYIEFGKPEYWTGSQWNPLPLGTPTRSGNTLLWDRPNYSLKLTVAWRTVKIEVVLKNASAAKRIRWPVSLIGLTWDAWALQSSGVTLCQVVKPIGWDANGSDMKPNVPVAASYTGGYVEFNADLTGAAYPVTIDPTLTLQPDATAGIDTFLVSGNPTLNYGVDIYVAVGNENTANNYTYRQLIKFDLSTLPSDAVISSAILSIYANVDRSSNTRIYGVYRQKRAWVEGTQDGGQGTGATWNTYDGTTNWETAGGFGANDCEQTNIGTRSFTATETLNEFKDFALTPSSKAALDLGNGWMIKADTEADDTYLFASSDNATAANRPKLVVVYTLAVAIAGTLASSGALVKRRDLVRAGTLATSAVLATVVNLLRAGTLASSGAIAVLKTKIVTVAGALTTAGALVVRIDLVRAGTLATAGTLTAVASKLLAGTLATSGTLVKSLRKVRAGALASAGVLVKSSSRSYAGTLASSGALVARINLIRTGTLATAGTPSAVVSKILAGTLVTSGALVKSLKKVRTGTLATAGSLAKIGQKVRAGTLATSGLLVKVPSKVFAGTLTSAGTLTKSLNKSLAGVLATAGVIAKVGTRAYAGTLATAGSLTKRGSFAFGGALTSSGALTRRVNKVLAGTLTSSGALVKEVRRVLNGTLATAGSLAAEFIAGGGTVFYVTVAGALATAGTLVKQSHLHLTGVLTTAGSLVKRIDKAFAGVLATAASILVLYPPRGVMRAILAGTGRSYLATIARSHLRAIKD